MQALLQAALQARAAPAPAAPQAQRSILASRPDACSGGSATEGRGSADGEPAMGATGVITSGARASSGRQGNSNSKDHASALGTAVRAALSLAPRGIPQTPTGPGRSGVGMDRGAGHPLMECAPHAGADPSAPPAPRAAQARPEGVTPCRARQAGPPEHAPAAWGWVRGGLHGHEPGDLAAAEASAAGGAPRDARPAWDDTVALHGEPRRRAPSPDPGQAPTHGPQAILAEALRRREALQRRMLATPQGLTPRGHPGSPRLTWQPARGAEAAAQQRCEWGAHPGWTQSGRAGASSEDSAGGRWRSPARRRQGASPKPLLGAALRQLDALEARMAGLVGRAGAQLGGLEPCQNPHWGPTGSSMPPRPASPAPAAADARAVAGCEEGTQAEAAALPTCSADGGLPGAADPGVCAAANAAGTHAGVLQTGRAGQPSGSGDRGVCSAAGAEQARAPGAGADDGVAELRAETAQRFQEQEECALAGKVWSV